MQTCITLKYVLVIGEDCFGITFKRVGGIPNPTFDFKPQSERLGGRRYPHGGSRSIIASVLSQI